jgi:hypothetical protein
MGSWQNQLVGIVVIVVGGLPFFEFFKKEVTCGGAIHHAPRASKTRLATGAMLL